MYRYLSLGLMTLSFTLPVVAETRAGKNELPGRLLDAQGQPLPDGDYELTFRIYDRGKS